MSHIAFRELGQKTRGGWIAWVVLVIIAFSAGWEMTPRVVSYALSEYVFNKPLFTPKALRVAERQQQ